MKESKPTGVRRQEIVQAARQLFLTKGYEATSTTDIMEAVGIAKGTLYYHFSSKEEILDALIDEMTDRMERLARPFGENSDLSLPDRMLGVIHAIQTTTIGEGPILDALHMPQNTLLHQKSHALTLERIGPVMLKIVMDGISQGILHSDHPRSAVHIALTYSLGTDFLSDPELANGFLYHLERMLGAEEGTLAGLSKLF